MKGRQEFLSLAAVAVASLVAVRILPREPVTGLAARYWPNASRVGAPVAERAGALPSTFDLRRSFAGRVPDAASAEWSGYFHAADAGVYEFELRSDDGSWLIVDGHPIIDNGGSHAPRSASGSIALSPGPHRVLVRYVQSGGGYSLELWYAKPGGARTLARPQDFSPSESAASVHARVLLFAAMALAIPTVWALLFLYLPLRVAGWWTWRAVQRAASGPGDRLAVAGVAVLAIALLVWGITWGLGGDGWAADELKPNLVRDALAHRFAAGWHDKYPPLQYIVLSIPVSAFALADHLRIIPAGSLAAEQAQLLLMRAISVVMSLGTLAAAYLCAVELRGPRLAILGPLALLLTPVFLYYGKVANLDVPSLCWLAFAFLFFLRICRANRFADYLSLGVTAAAAVATKDQAYASLALLPIAIVIANVRRRDAPRAAVAAAVAVRLLAGAAASLVAFAVFFNLPFNAAGFAAHVHMLATWGGIALVPRTVQGYLELIRTAASLYRLSLGWPLFVMAILGVASAVRRPERRWWGGLALSIVSFHLFFTCVSLFVTDRYQLGGTFILALFAGAACADLLEAIPRRTAGVAAVGLVLGCSLLSAASVDVMMDVDGRYETRRRLAAEAGDRRVVALVGEYMPALDPPLVAERPAASPAAVERLGPDFVMVNANYARRFEGDPVPDGRDLLRRLADGTLGYVEAFRYRGPVPVWALLQYEPVFRGQGDYGLTNLNKLNPEMVVYRRADR